MEGEKRKRVQRKAWEGRKTLTLPEKAISY
jgi:hypothetical protein